MRICIKEGGKIISNLDDVERKGLEMSIGMEGRESLYKENKGYSLLVCFKVFSRHSWPPTPSPEGHRSLANLLLASLVYAGWELCV